MHEAPTSSPRGLKRLKSAEAQAEAAALARRIRRRSALDGAVIVLVTLLVTGIASGEHQMLLHAIGCVSIGILLFMIRRSQDVVALTRADDWRDRAVAGRGMRLADWHAGAALPGWAQRRDEAA
jgi:hypothetical protein